MRKAVLAFTLCFVLFVTLATNAPILAQQAQPTTVSPTVEPTITPQSDPEVIALRAQLEQMRQTDSQLLDTVLWALAGVFTLAAAIVFYNGFVTNRNYERDKAAMMQDLRAMIREEISSFQQSLHTEAAQQYEKIAKDARESGNAAATQLRKELSAIRSDLFETQYKMLEDQAEKQEAQKYYDSALFTCCEMLNVTPNLVLNQLSTADVLDRMQRILKVAKDLDADTITRVAQALDKLPSQYATIKTILQKLLLSSQEASI